MSTETVAGKIKQVKGQSKQKRAERDQNPVEMLEGKRDGLVGLAQEKYGQAKEKTEQVAGDLSHRADIAKQTVDQRLDQYNRTVETTAARLPGDLNATITRYPWVTVAAMLALGFLIGLWVKPCFNKYDFEHRYYSE